MILIFTIHIKCKIRVSCRTNFLIMKRLYNIFSKPANKNFKSKLNMEFWIKICKLCFRILIHCLYRIRLDKSIKIMIWRFIKNWLIKKKTQYKHKKLVYLIIYSRTLLVNRIFWVRDFRRLIYNFGLLKIKMNISILKLTKKQIFRNWWINSVLNQNS